MLVLDIEMGQMNGMELAMKLRKEKEKNPVLFVTGFERYMSLGYEVDALHYLLSLYRRKSCLLFWIKRWNEGHSTNAEADEYLDKLEENLKTVDTVLKTGNIMAI